MRSPIAPGTIVPALMAFVAYPGYSQPWPPMRIAGAIVSLIAFTLLILSRIQLGRAFSVSPQAKHLVTSGIYSRLRNPLYVFLQLLLFGLALFFMTWWPLVVAAILLPLQVLQARRESAVLLAAFGDQYTLYRQQTWF